MKKSHLLKAIFLGLMIGIVLLPLLSSAAGPPAPDNFFTAPVMPGGTVVSSDETRAEVAYDLPFATVLAWYKEAFKSYKDEKYRDWQEQMYIEDQDGAKWHSIGISKGGGNKTTVTFVKDNWTWIFSTLLIRFAGVFIILLCLWILLNISSAITRKIVDRQEAKSTAS